MKPTLLLLAALLTTPLAYAQRDYRDTGDIEEDVVAPIEDELDRLREDEDVVEFAQAELELAEDFIEDLAALSPNEVEDEDVEEAMRMLARAERVARRRSGSEQGQGQGREVIVVNDPAAENEAREARSEAEQARFEADQNRGDAEQARLEAERERAENTRLRAELGQAQTRVTERGVIFTLGDVLFAVGKADLMSGGMRGLDKLVAAMRRDPDSTVSIDGHTDSTGQRAYNMDLSKRRANAVRSYLMVKGVASKRIKSRGLGPDSPVASNANAAGRQQNRRVEILVQNDGFDR